MLLQQQKSCMQGQRFCCHTVTSSNFKSNFMVKDVQATRYHRHGTDIVALQNKIS